MTVFSAFQELGWRGSAFLPVFAAYVSISYLCLKYPRLLHSKKRSRAAPRRLGKQMLLIAHRGGAAEMPENTMLAFRRALTVHKTDMIETDVWLTADKVLVACHDNDLEHVCGTKTLVQATNHKGLPLMKDSSTLRPADTYLHSPFVGFPNEFPPQPIPKFEEVLEQCPDAFLHVDIKPFNCPEAVDMALDLVRRNGALTRVVFSSFCRRNNRRIRAAQRTDGEVMRTVGPHKLIAAVLAYYVGLLPFMPFSEDAVALPQCGRFFSGAREEFSDDVQRFVGRPLARLLSGAAVVIVGGAFKSRTFIQHLRDRGIATYAWVLNEPEEFERADKLGVDGIMTDFPSTLRRYIDKNG
eukprot:GHVU01078500.1.p1 GENE.GHVU01078500.1~~GHVU01078500.1.p1  ORF type:complete len:354 (+),score=48.25 GHVU01078500.1:105-1166(+)